MNFYRCYRVRSGRRTLVVGRVNVTVWCLSVCPSVCPIYRPLRQRAAGLLLCVRPAGYRSMAARPALSYNCEQCHVVS